MFKSINIKDHINNANTELTMSGNKFIIFSVYNPDTGNYLESVFEISDILNAVNILKQDNKDDQK